MKIKYMFFIKIYSHVLCTVNARYAVKLALFLCGLLIHLLKTGAEQFLCCLLKHILINIHFSDVTLLFEQWNIFKNLPFILLFLNIWTLTFYCFSLKNVIYIFCDFRYVSNHCWVFISVLSKLPSLLRWPYTYIL